ncbi:choice-of-anchor B family protein [Natronospira bacteriovora]|uniref:Choice-of-anchor B family protein n=1 Tax=Natronospira bacteriovora TaxID=3069753 RepID=A0ABU0W573_9GAMM|nr:choice-of-anchor B family protein [Natronospira sp. AB-CW4]MDQ2069168.1 choice-of-anchor B family protein [Natronospira sp. AB-CW4]
MKALIATFLALALSIPASAQAFLSAECEDGMAGPYPCSRVDLLAFMPASSLGGGTFNDVWGWTDPETGREYAIVGRFGGTSFVDITDPSDPVFLGQLPTRSVSSGAASRSPDKSRSQLLCHDDCEAPTPGDGSAGSAWRDAKVYADHAFIVSEEAGHGMQVFDLRRLRDVSDPPVTFDEDAHYSGFGNAHNIELNVATGMAYAVGSQTFNGGPHFIDVTDPQNPSPSGGYGGDGYTHDAQCVIYSGPDEDFHGHEVCFNSNENSLTLLDVSDHSSPTMISRTVYPNVAYTHQGWLSEDQRWFYLNDEMDARSHNTRTRTVVWDVSDLRNPVVADQYYSPDIAIAHNNYVRGGFLYQSNYTSGLRILDISRPDRPVEYAYLDSQPGTHAHQFRGTWSNFPWFESGTVVFTDIEDGLFIVKPLLPLDEIVEANLQLTANLQAPMAIRMGNWTRGARVRVQIENAGPFPAGGVELLASLPVRGEIRLLESADADCIDGGRKLRCRLDSLQAGAAVVLDLDVRSEDAVDEGLIVSVTSELNDPDMGDNRVHVSLPRPDLALPFAQLEEGGSGCSLAQRDPLLAALLLIAFSGLFRARRRRSP